METSNRDNLPTPNRYYDILESRGFVDSASSQQALFGVKISWPSMEDDDQTSFFREHRIFFLRFKSLEKAKGRTLFT